MATGRIGDHFRYADFLASQLLVGRLPGTFPRKTSPRAAEKNTPFRLTILCVF
jgi:hypothetical protein